MKNLKYLLLSSVALSTVSGLSAADGGGGGFNVEREIRTLKVEVAALKARVDIIGGAESAEAVTMREAELRAITSDAAAKKAASDTVKSARARVRGLYDRIDKSIHDGNKAALVSNISTAGDVRLAPDDLMSLLGKLNFETIMGKFRETDGAELKALIESITDISAV